MKQTSKCISTLLLGTRTNWWWLLPTTSSLRIPKLDNPGKSSPTLMTQLQFFFYKANQIAQHSARNNWHRRRRRGRRALGPLPCLSLITGLEPSARPFIRWLSKGHQRPIANYPQKRPFLHNPKILIKYMYLNEIIFKFVEKYINCLHFSLEMTTISSLTSHS